MMNHIVIVPPAIEPLSLEEVKNYLRIDTDHENELISRLVRAARSIIEDYTGLALITQTWRMTCCGYDVAENSINLGKGPFQELVRAPRIKLGHRVKAIQNYRLNKSRLQAKIRFLDFIDSDQELEIDYRCGYGDSPASIPEPLCQAILLFIADLYENRPGDKTSQALPGMIRALINPYRIIRLY